jgi:hypothetical protein
MNPYVKSLQAGDDHKLLLKFDNGEKRVFDIKPYLDKPVFAKLQNINLFKTARVVSGSVEWAGDVDLSYDTLYVESKPTKATEPRRITTRTKNKSLAMAVIPKKKPAKSRLASK